MFLKFVDRTATKHEIQAALIDLAARNGEPISDARALNLADKFKRGKYDPDLARFIQYSDPVGEEAASNVDKERLVAA